MQGPKRLPAGNQENVNEPGPVQRGITKALRSTKDPDIWQKGASVSPLPRCKLVKAKEEIRPDGGLHRAVSQVVHPKARTRAGASRWRSTECHKYSVRSQLLKL